jgi:ParB/RepB/Spo0J family partition protein
MKPSKKIRQQATRPRKNVADSIDGAAKRISASLHKTPSSDVWDQERIENLRGFDGKVGEIPIQIIKTNENVRKRIDENEPAFKELVESIRAHGILQPPIVTIVTSDRGHSSVLLVGGERRLRAASAAGYKAVNCMVRIFDSQTTRLTASMSENMTRKDLNCLDIAHCFLSLSDQGYKYADIEKLFSRDEKTIGRYIKMARWSPRIQEKIRDHPEKFTVRFLFSLVSKKMSESDLDKEIEARLAGKNPAQDGSTKNKGAAMVSRFSSYCENKKLGNSEKELIYQALIDLGIIVASDGSGAKILRRLP